ncbi:Hypothetical protein FKW44_015593 [Caligus rogercresseyi]|uniref:Uncharacterized protein n=1 Tax=Caligus rogercresseyi TaxID=217165 RepID=A0A7T8JZS6_CALRO|nr:Hypothetical protein FKW44_015593 [Caligus rogercresseyi]
MVLIDILDFFHDHPTVDLYLHPHSLNKVLATRELLSGSSKKQGRNATSPHSMCLHFSFSIGTGSPSTTRPT